MKFLILGLLLRRPLSLYELHTRFAAGLTHIYAASYGSIHRALRQLHAEGEVELVEDSTVARNTKRYLATDQGGRSWLEWMKQPQPTEDSEASMLARVFLLGLLERPADRRKVLLALHQRALNDLEALRRIDPTAGASEQDSATLRYPRAALDYGVCTSEGAVTWLERLLSDLTSLEGVKEPDGATEPEGDER